MVQQGRWGKYEVEEEEGEEEIDCESRGEKKERAY